MLNRIFKTILIISTCLSSIASQAAVSVSDGSAFVTKAEFSADLNSLSNRMAQLENSLDSKIDSLVSTYLKKNGIWSGKKQTLLKNDIIDFWSANNLTEAQGAHWDFKSNFSTGSLTQGVECNLRYQEFDFIHKCDKSGMLLGKVDVVNGYDIAKKMAPSSSGTDGRNFTFFSISRAYDNPAVMNCSSLSFINAGNIVSNCVPIEMGVERRANEYASLWIVPSVQTYNPVFFVNNGDEIKVRYIFSFSPQTSDAKNNWSNVTLDPVGSYPGVGIVFGDFYIY